MLDAAALEQICRDGYRADLDVADGGGIEVVVTLVAGGEAVARAAVWRGPYTSAARVTAERVLRLVWAVCRFNNCEDDSGPGTPVAYDVVAALTAGLPRWRRSGLSYLAGRGGDVDVVFGIPGGPAVRVVEDQFAEVLDNQDLLHWFAERAEEAEAEGGEDDDG